METQPATDCWIVERNADALGRLYINRAHRVWRIIDIALLPECQKQGLGGMLVQWVKSSARAARADGVDLHVLDTNCRAAALYARMGFASTDAGTPTHRHMIWRVS
ncbi:GNAT family N-acetyltransferase [Brevundimonas sp.]|uniref:GNAT family N-acetyltransferase n=1 Tax=Brevundimonas sp. TaxID=1871086 RepID=UPI003D14F7B2